MKTYRVTEHRNEVVTYIVTAENEEQAEELAYLGTTDVKVADLQVIERDFETVELSNEEV